MTTRLDYQRMILNGIEPGKPFRIKCDNAKHYASQRMMFYRAMQEVKKSGFPTENICSRKIEDRFGIFLEVFYQGISPVLQLQEDGTWKEVMLSNPNLEEEEFARWEENTRKELSKEEMLREMLDLPEIGSESES